MGPATSPSGMDRVRLFGSLASVVVAAFLIGSLVGLGWSSVERPAVAVGAVLIAAFVGAVGLLGASTTDRLENAYW